jgi:heme-degrading monooxygenase HmoA
MTTPAEGTRARVVFLIRVPADRTADFLSAYDKIRYVVAEGVDGHLLDQVCQSEHDPEQWMITSEWTSLGAFKAWERSPDHRDLVAPMRACFTEAKSLRFVVHAQTGRRARQAPPSPRARRTPRPPGANPAQRPAAANGGSAEEVMTDV